MQEWKIKRMSVELLEKWLDSVDKLLLHYLRAPRLEVDNCPLCWAECANCLWHIIERKSCVDFMMELYLDKTFSVDTVITLRRNLRFKKWKDARIKQLEHWRCIIAGELAGRYVKKSKKEEK